MNSREYFILSLLAFTGAVALSSVNMWYMLLAVVSAYGLWYQAMVTEVQ